MEKRTQQQMYREEHQKIADLDRQVMELINCKENPLTRKDLHALADKYPNRYEKYRTLLDNKDHTPNGKPYGRQDTLFSHIS